jgi:hypothetical protein
MLRIILVAACENNYKFYIHDINSGRLLVFRAFKRLSSNTFSLFHVIHLRRSNARHAVAFNSCTLPYFQLHFYSDFKSTHVSIFELFGEIFSFQILSPLFFFLTFYARASNAAVDITLLFYIYMILPGH